MKNTSCYQLVSLFPIFDTLPVKVFTYWNCVSCHIIYFHLRFHALVLEFFLLLFRSLVEPLLKYELRKITKLITNLLGFFISQGCIGEDLFGSLNAQHTIIVRRGVL